VLARSFSFKPAGLSLSLLAVTRTSSLLKELNSVSLDNSRLLDRRDHEWCAGEGDLQYTYLPAYCTHSRASGTTLVALMSHQHEP
jgi:hypothetical protein